MRKNKNKHNNPIVGGQKPAQILSIEAKFHRAKSFFQNGNFTNAKILLNEILTADPRHAESWFFSALIAEHEGFYHDAINNLGVALEIDPKNLRYLFTIGDLYYGQNYLDEGVKIFEFIIKIEPEDFNGYYNLACFYQKQAKYEQALSNFKKSLELNGNNINAIYNIGNIFIDTKDYKNAIQYFKKVIEIQPDSDDTLNNLGFLHTEFGDLDNAALYLNQAISINPKNFNILNNLGKLYEKKGLFTDAFKYFDATIKLKPDYAEAYSNRGAILNQLKEYNAALIDFDKALALNPFSAEAHSNKGNTLREVMRFEEALQSYTKAISLNPNYAEAYSNRGVALKELRRLDEALSNFEKAITLEPGYSNGYLNKSILLLMTKKFDEGWKLYSDWRWKSTPLDSEKLNTSIPYWERKIDNIEVQLLLWAEQGIGDEVFYFGMLSNFSDVNARVTISADIRLHTLFKRSMPNVDFIDRKEIANVCEENAFDFQAPIGDIGQLLSVDKSIKHKIPKPFLQINRSRCTDIKNKNNFLADKFVCGISWKSTNKDIGVAKSLNLIDLSPLLSIENIEFVSLQYGSTTDEIELVEKTIGKKVHTIDGLDIFNDIEGLVALIDNCDFVVTTSNITAHLTGAIGKKGMVLIPYSKGKIWYWHSGVGQSLWYPSLKLVSQTKINDWTDPIYECKEWILEQI